MPGGGSVGRRLAGLTAVVLAVLVAAGPAGGPVAATPAPAPAPVPAALRVSPSPSVVPSPSVDPVDAAQAAIDGALAVQTAALLRGDRAGFLAIGEPGNRKVAADLGRRFGSLRALRIAGFAQAVEAGLSPDAGAGGRDEWTAEISVGTCFVDAGCAPSPARVQTRWLLRPDGARLVSVAPVARNEGGPLPWEVDDLRAAVGKRVVVATTARYASRLRAAVAAADRAAAVADRYLFDGRPRYLIFLAGAKAGRTWYGGNPADWAWGFVTRTGPRIDVVLRVEKFPWGEVEPLLRHEMTHVATLGGGTRQVFRYHKTWWAVEGIAEFAEVRGSDYGSAAEIRRYLRETGWNCDPQTIAAGSDDPQWRVDATYGIAYHCVRRLADRFGHRRMVAFVDAVLRTERNADDAARLVLGVSWKSVKADFRSYVRDVVDA